MKEKLDGLLEDALAESDKGAFFYDCEIICYLLENAEISFPEERSFSFNINADWHLNRLSIARAEKIVSDCEERDLLSKENAFAFKGYSDWGHTSTSWDDVLTLGIFGIAERVFKMESEAVGENRRFYSALSRVFEAVVSFVERGAREAKKCGRVRLSEALFAMTKRAPSTLYEALVTILLYYNLHLYINHNNQLLYN